MIISTENLELLRVWLIKKLSPICDAEPTALAKYVIALIKKDKKEEDLKMLCYQQLEIFLKNNTDDFVNLLFASLKNESYLPKVKTEVKEEKEKSMERKVKSERRDLRKDRDYRRSSTSPRQRHARSPRRTRSRSPRRHKSPKDVRSRLGYRKMSPDSRRRFYRRRSRSHSPPRRRNSPRRRYRHSSPNRKSPPRRRSRSTSNCQENISVSETNGKKKVGKCYDFEEKGFCVKGDSCPYDHGNDVVAVDDDPDAIDLGTSPSDVAKQPVTQQVLPPIHIPPPTLLARPPTFNVPPPQIFPNYPPPPLSAILPPIPYQPEMVKKASVVIGCGAGLKRRFVNDLVVPNCIDDGIAPKKKPFVGHRKVLLITRIPSNLNNIMKINEHFQKFGSINNIQVRFNGRNDQCVVEFAHHNSAKAAYSSPASVHGNRFIRVLWYDESKQAKGVKYVSTSEDNKVTVKDRLGVVSKININKNDEETSEINSAAEKAKKKADEAKEKLLKMQECAKKQVDEAKKRVKEKLENEKKLQEKKQEIKEMTIKLLNQQATEQKSLLKHIESNPKMTKEEKTAIEKKSAALEKSILELRQMLKKAAGVGKIEKSKEELGLADQDKNKKPVQVFAHQRSHVMRSRGAKMMGRMSKFHKSGHCLDRRPSNLKVAGFKLEERDDVLAGLAEFGELEYVDFKEQELCYIVKYKFRSTALQVLVDQLVVNKKLLHVDWEINKRKDIIKEEIVPKVPPNQKQIKTEKSSEQILSPQEPVQSLTQEEAEILKELSDHEHSDADTEVEIDEEEDYGEVDYNENFYDIEDELNNEEYI